jgi:hypothetical protein
MSEQEKPRPSSYSPRIRLDTKMKELEAHHGTSYGAYPDETVEEFLERKEDTILLRRLREG